MKQIWLLILLPMLWVCLVFLIALAVDDPLYLVWGILLPVLLTVLYALSPRRGIHYAYWNRYTYIFGVLLLGLGGVPFLVGYLSLWIKSLGTVFETFFLPWLISFPIAWILWFKFLFMPAWGPWRLRGRYPQMVAMARKLKKFPEQYGWYFPLIFVQGKPYLVASYTDRYLTGLVTLDEEGRFVKDEGLALLLLRCYKLAVSALDMPGSLARAHQIDNFQKTDHQMQKSFRCFREENEEYFSVTGKNVHNAWKIICDFEPNFHTTLMTLTERRMWQAQWAREHGLNRLTEVSDQELFEAEACLSNFNRTLLSYREKLDQVSTEAEVMQLVLPKLHDPWETATGKLVRLKHRNTIVGMLESLVWLRQVAEIGQEMVVDFFPTKNEWSVWQTRKVMAERLEQAGKI